MLSCLCPMGMPPTYMDLPLIFTSHLALHEEEIHALLEDAIINKKVFKSLNATFLTLILKE